MGIYVGNKRYAPYIGDKRRRYMGGKKILPANSYIQDGLIFQLDGFEKGSVNNAWVDLVGGYVFEFVSGMSSKNNCVEFTSNRTEIFSTDGTIQCMRNSATIEVVHKNNGGITQAFTFTGGVSGSLAFGCEYNSSGQLTRVVQSTTWYPSNTRAPSQTILASDVNTISITDTTSMFNGVIGGNGSGWVNSPITEQKIIVGSNTTGSRLFVGELYAVRVYNRNLSTDEMLFNQQVDNSRFNLGLTI